MQAYLRYDGIDRKKITKQLAKLLERPGSARTESSVRISFKCFPSPSMQKGKVYTEGTPANLPSSLTNIVPDALGFSPHPPVSVCGTNTI